MDWYGIGSASWLEVGWTTVAAGSAALIARIVWRRLGTWWYLHQAGINSDKRWAATRRLVIDSGLLTLPLCNAVAGIAAMTTEPVQVTPTPAPTVQQAVITGCFMTSSLVVAAVALYLTRTDAALLRTDHDRKDAQHAPEW